MWFVIAVLWIPECWANCTVLPYPNDARLRSDQCRRLEHLRFVPKERELMFYCPILAKMINRHTKVQTAEMRGKSELTCAGGLEPINVVLLDTQACNDVFPTIEDVDESYTITIPSNGAPVISAETIWGINYALQTFGQLIVRSSEPFVYVGVVRDSPRYKYRGLMLDTARHFLPVELIKRHLDAMSFCKMNIFHWHIVDDESFPYQSINQPDLSQFGAFDPLFEVYSLGDILEIDDYARALGIRLILELDSPGHTRSWSKSLLTYCEESGEYESFNPASEQAWDTLKSIIGELIQVNPPTYIHLGGDEVNTTCWRQNKNVSALMDKLGIKDNYDKLLEYYAKRLLLFISSEIPDTVAIFWDDMLDSMEVVPDDAIFQVWRSKPRWEKITALNLSYIYSSCFYINHISYGDDWKEFYNCNLEQLPNREGMLGGEACMWAEYVDDSNSLSRTWPRAAAIAERLWTTAPEGNQTITERLNEFTCLLKRRGIPAQPINSKWHCPLK